MGHMSAKTKIFIWVLVFGIGAILCSVISERQYWNISSYGMLCQLICDSDYVVSVTANLIVTVFVVGIRLIISGGGFKNELHRSK